MTRDVHALFAATKDVHALFAVTPTATSVARGGEMNGGITTGDWLNYLYTPESAGLPATTTSRCGFPDSTGVGARGTLCGWLGGGGGGGYL